jgi:hypothetical protein
MADKETLKAEIEDLKTTLQPQFERDRARVQAEGRSFDPLRWVLGVPDSHKYPAGPAYIVRRFPLLRRGTAARRRRRHTPMISLRLS